MSVCPRCGAEIEVDTWRELAQTGADDRRELAQTGADLAQMRIALKPLDLSPSPNGARAKIEPYPYDFELFWKVYPLRKGKRKALKAWRIALARVGASTGATRREAEAQLIAGARRYAAQVEEEGIDRPKYAEGWLNDDRWEDEPAPDPRRETRRALTVAEEIERSQA